MLREIGLFIITSTLLSTLVLLCLPATMPAWETVCGDTYVVSRGDLAIAEGAHVSRSMRVGLLLEIHVHGFYPNNVSDAYLFAIPEKTYMSRLVKALPHLERALRMYEELLERDLGSELRMAWVATAEENVGRALSELGRGEEAEEHLERAERIREELAGRGGS